MTTNGGEAPLPKQDLLIKLLRLTESDNPGEALSAIRKANALLRSAKWDWEKLIRGKITIVEDPFKSVPEPKVSARETSSAGTVPPKPRVQPRPQADVPSRPRPTPSPPPTPNPPQYTYTPRQRAPKPAFRTFGGAKAPSINDL